MSLYSVSTGQQIKSADLDQLVNLLTGVMTDQPIKLANTPLYKPSAGPTVTPTGTPGTTGYSYYIVGVNALGDTMPGPTGSTSTGNATLNGTNYNAISWAAVPGAASYKVIRSAGGATQGVIATGITGTSYNDQGAAASAYTAATVDPRGGVQAAMFAPTGLTGATAAMALVGGTTSGAPTSGTFNKGDAVLAEDGFWWICTVAGTPGTWKLAGAALETATPAALAAAGAAGSSLNAAHGDHVHPWTGLGVLANAQTWAAAQTFSAAAALNAGATVAASQYLQFGSGGRIMDDGTYLHFQAAAARSFYVESSFANTYIYSTTIYLGDGSTAGNTVSLRNAALTKSYNANDNVPTLPSGAGARLWIQGTDPGASANNGDVWFGG